MDFILDIFNALPDLPYFPYLIAALSFNCLIKFTEILERNSKQ